MKVTKVSYSKSFEIITPIGTVWEKIGLEGELGEEETPEQGLSELKVIVDAFHEAANPGSIVKPEQDTYTTVVPTKREAVKIAPDDSIRLEFALASSKGDEKTVQSLLKIYDFSLPRKQNEVHPIPAVNA